MTIEEKIWQRLKAAGYNDFGIAGMMGNLYAESALSPTNLQNEYNQHAGYQRDHLGSITIFSNRQEDL